MIILPEPAPGTFDLRSPGRLLFGLAVRQRWSLAGVAVMGSGWMLSQAGVPLVVGRTIDAGVARHDGRALLTGCLVLVALALVTAGTGILRHRLAVSNWMQAALRTQQLIGFHVADQGPAVAAGTTTGEVVETVSTDAPRIGELYDVVGRGSGAVLSYVVVAVLLLRMDLLVGAWVALGVPLLSATLAAVLRPLQARQKVHREREGRLTALGADTVAGLRVLRGIGGEEQFVQRYRVRSQEVRRAGVHVAALQATLDATQVLLPGVFVVSLTWLAARAALSGRLTAGELVTIYGYAAFLRIPLETAGEVLSKAVLARVAAARMIAVLTRADVEPHLAGDHAGPLEMPPAGATVSDPESGLVIASGLLTALVSARPEQAAGIADRLARLDRPEPPPSDQPDHVDQPDLSDASAPDEPDHRAHPARPRSPRIGDVPLDRLPVDAVRRRILVSEAEPRLFTGTLRAQIDPDGERSDAEVLAALTVADGTDLLDGLPDGLGTQVQERGRGFSGGQRQRLVLARAVLADPELLVLVEPTSAVDAHTEARVADRLRVARTGRTTLVITASPLLLDRCDEVAFLVDGEVVAQGTHRRLLREHPGYRQVVIRDLDGEPDDDELNGGEPDDGEHLPAGRTAATAEGRR